jgi:tetratricopeptide (TPR) repeat protein
VSYADPGASYPEGGPLPQDEISYEFASELDALAANSNAMALMEEGANLFKAGDFVGALEAFRKAVLAEKANAVPKFAMAHALFALGEYEYAAFMIRRGMEILPSWPSVGADLRDLYGNPDDLMEQSIALQVYRDSHPDNLEATLLHAYVSFFSGDLDGAEEQFRATAALDAADTVAPLFLTRITEIRGLLEEQGVEAEDPSELTPDGQVPPEPPEPEYDGETTPPAQKEQEDDGY